MKIMVRTFSGGGSVGVIAGNEDDFDSRVRRYYADIALDYMFDADDVRRCPDPETAELGDIIKWLSADGYEVYVLNQVGEAPLLDRATIEAFHAQAAGILADSPAYT
jgi:hypothetical protein